ncbi:MAG: UPF0280 family protein [Actinobacteria bacterium]|nr:UPF0280 family protein [Actinomycetota bacterium]
MHTDENLLIERLLAPNLFLDKDIYRVLVNSKSRFRWKINYKYKNTNIISNVDISSKIPNVLIDFYKVIEEFIKNNPVFAKTFNAFNTDIRFPEIVKKMCRGSVMFNVGPMASIAGAVCEYMAEELSKKNSYLAIENGGDIYIKSQNDVITGLFLKSKYFRDNLKMKIKKELLPCGIASSSGTLGHSLSLGKSDLIVVVCKSAILADSAATAAGNLIKTKEDIEKTLNYFTNFKEILAMVIIKDDKIGLYGNIELV